MLDVIHNRRSAGDVEFARNWVLGRDNRVYFYDFYEKRRRRFVHFNIIDLDGGSRLRRRLSARSATWQGERTLLLRDGFSREFRGQLPAAMRPFRKLRLDVAENQKFFTEKVRFTGAMNSSELRDYIRYLEAKRSDPLRYRAQLYNNYAFPFSSLVMVFIAIPFSFLMGNRGALFGIGIAVGVSMIYWGALGIFSALGTTGSISPLLAAFAPLVLFSLVSLFLFFKIRT
jgi:lipopolysaccharide export system permease protein